MFCENGVLKSFAIYKRKCLHWSPFLIKLQVFSLHFIQKTYSGTNFLLWILQNCCFFFLYIPWQLPLKEHWISLKISVFKASCEKEFVLFSLFVPAQIQVWARINWCWCGTSYTIFTCLASGVWWIPHSMERFYGCVTKSILVRACVLTGAILIVFK